MSTSNPESTTPAAIDPYGVIVVGVDGSPTARIAAERAALIAGLSGTRLHLVCSLKSGGGEVIQGPGGDTWTDDPYVDARILLTDIASRWPALETTVAAVPGKPADALVDQANELGASLIVVGNRRMHGIGRLLGAIANDVAHQATCDVLIVNTTR